MEKGRLALAHVDTRVSGCLTGWVTRTRCLHVRKRATAVVELSTLGCRSRKTRQGKIYQRRFGGTHHDTYAKGRHGLSGVRGMLPILHGATLSEHVLYQQSLSIRAACFH